MNIVFASHSYFSENLVVGSHHLSRALAKEGHKILHISTPLTLGHLWKKRNYLERIAVYKQERRVVEENLIEVVPLTLFPWPFSKIFVSTGINLYLKFSPSLRKYLKYFNGQQIDCLFIDEPRFAGLQKEILAKKVVYRATDLYSLMRSDLSLTFCEKRLLNVANGFVATSRPVYDHLRDLSPDSKGLIIENGVDTAMFSKACTRPSEYNGLEKPILLYVGAVDYRISLDAIAFASTANIEVVIAGPVSVDISKLESISNVHFLGAVSYVKVPALMQYAAAGFLPTNDHPANEGRSPMKFYEYLASGLPVIAARTAELESRKQMGVYLYRDHAQLRSSLTEHLKASSLLSGRILQDEAARYGWEKRAKTLMKFCAALD